MATTWRPHGDRMTFDSLIGVAGLATALWAVMPRHRRLDIRRRMTWVDATSLLVALLLVHYLQFYATFAQLGWTLSLPIAQYGFTPENSSYLVVLTSAAFIACS